MSPGKHRHARLIVSIAVTVIIGVSCAGAPVSELPSRRPAIAVDESLTAPDTTTAIAWVSRRPDGRLFVVGKVFDTHRSEAMVRATTQTLVGPVSGGFMRLQNSFGLTITRVSGGYFVTWCDGPLLFGQFWNEALTASRSEPISFTPRASTPPDQVEAVYDPHREKILVTWRSDLMLFSGTVNSDRRILIRTGVNIASQALHFDVAANKKRSASPAFLVSYITGRSLRDLEVRSFTLSGPALGALTKSAEVLITDSAVSTEYERVAVSYNNSYNGFVTVFTHGEQIEAVAQDHLGAVAFRHELGSRRVFWQRTGSNASVRHPERWYELECPINPNGLAVLIFSQTAENPTERSAELHLYARPIRGLGTESGVTLGADSVLRAGSTDTTRRLHFQHGVRAGWNGAFEMVWERVERSGDLDTLLGYEAQFGAVNARAQAVD